MLIDALKTYDIEHSVIDIWKRTGHRTLLPVQIKAVKECKLLEGGNIIVSAPTSSGKTFLAEMAAVRAAWMNKKVLYLVPQKALAEEKYWEFHRRYKHMGVSVLVSTRDHPEFDDLFYEGNFHIAVVVFEKLQSLLVSRMGILDNVGLIIVDELQLMGDPDRGPGLEMLLTQVKLHAPDAQLLGLSAVLGGGERLARWLNAGLCSVPDRPVELRKGVIHKGQFHFIEHNSKREGNEPVYEEPKPSVSMQVKHFAEMGESCLVFCPSRRDCIEMAESIITRLRPKRSARALEELANIEASAAKAQLAKLLEFGVAYHNSDLTWNLRALVERHYRSGDIAVICCTSTLAMGLNLPARNVFIHPQRWQQDHAGNFQKVNLPLAEFDNMSGRAGRLGHSHEFGRAIIVAKDEFDAGVLFRTYVRGTLGELKPALKSDALNDHVLNLIASKRCSSRGQLRTFLLASYTGEQCWRGEENEPEFLERLDEAIEHCCSGNLIQKSDLTLKVTALGRLTAIKGISAETSVALANFVNDRKHCALEVHPLEILLALTNTPEAMANQLKFNRETDYFEGSLEMAFLGSVHSLQPTTGRRLRSFLCKYARTEEQTKNLKKTLMLRDWIAGETFSDIELIYQCAAGAVRNFAAEFRWLCDALEAIAALMYWPSQAVRQVRILTQRLAYGVSAEAVVFCEAKVRGLERIRALALAEHGIRSLEEAARMPLAELEKVITRYVATNLVQHVKSAQQNAKADSESPRIDELATAATVTEMAPSSPQNQVFDKVGNPFRAADQKLYIGGAREKRRAKIILNGGTKTLTAQSFEILLHLAVAMKGDGMGWVSIQNPDKPIQRLRDALATDQIDRTELIESDGAKRYRLSIPPESIELDEKAILSSFPDSTSIFNPPSRLTAAAS